MGLVCSLETQVHVVEATFHTPHLTMARVLEQKVFADHDAVFWAVVALGAPWRVEVGCGVATGVSSF